MKHLSKPSLVKSSLASLALAVIAVTALPARSISAPISACEAIFEPRATTRTQLEPSLEPLLDPLSEREIKAAIKHRAQMAREFRSTLRLPSIDTTQQIASAMQGDMALLKPVTLQEIVLNEPQSTAVARNKIINAYVSLAKQIGRPITEKELAAELQLKSAELLALFGPDLLFGDIDAVKAEAQKRKPEAFRKFVDTKIFNSARQKALLDAVMNRQRLFVTTAVAKTRVHMDLLNAMLRARTELDADILVFAANMELTFLDPVLLNTPGIHIITESILLNKDVRLNNIKILAKMKFPLAGLMGIYPRGESQIVGSPKLHFDTVPTVGNEYRHHFLSTTAAITKKNYRGRHIVQERTNEIAAEDAVLGAMILEKSMGTTNPAFPDDVTRSGFFHMRHITFSEEHRGFADLNRFYPTDGPSRQIRVPFLPFPDLHIGELSEKVARRLINTLKFFQTEYMVAHDFFNGHSVSKHERDKMVSRAKAFRSGRLNLADELISGAVALNAILRASPNLKILVPEANHNDWLTRYLQEGQWMKEPHNQALGAELYNFMVNGDSKESVLMYAYKKFGLENPKRVIFLDENSFYASAFEFAQHGHQGANGAKGSMNSMVQAADNIVFGHTHVTRRRKNTINIATGTALRLPYSQWGASSWSNSLAAVSDYGAQVLLWTHDELYATSKVPEGEGFFPPGFPKVVPRDDVEDGDFFDGQQVDQHSRFLDNR